MVDNIVIMVVADFYIVVVGWNMVVVGFNIDVFYSSMFIIDVGMDVADLNTITVMILDSDFDVYFYILTLD